MWCKIREKLTWWGLKGVSLLPLGLLYPLTGAVAWAAWRLVGYRRGVVQTNLRATFPEKDEKWLRKTEREYYRFLGEYAAETLRLGSMGEKEMRRRLRIEGIDEVNTCLDRGQHVTLYLGHYCNWEWVSSLPLWLKMGENIVGCQIYKPQRSSPALDKALLKIRGRFGAHSIKKSDTLRALLGYHRDRKVTVTGYIADQVPGSESIHLSVPFLSHEDTPVFTGAERIGKALGSAAFYVDLRRERRGHYVGRMVKLSDDMGKEEQYAVTRRYFEELERSIRRQPGLWLWSHRRWKRSGKR